MVQIKVTPEELERIAKRANDTKHALESIHKDLYNQIEHLAYQWNGASMQKFYQDFNEAKPIAFTATNAIANTEEELKRIAEKFRKADNEDVTAEQGEMCGPSSSEKEGFDGKKLARDIAGELTGEYDVRRVWDGVDPSTGAKLSIWNRFLAGGMVIAGLTPVGKLAKVGKGVKMSANAAEAAKATKGIAKPKYVPMDTNGKKLGLPRNNDGKLVNGTSHKPDSMNPHTQIGIKKGRKGDYIQTLEWGKDGKPIQRTDWTDHGRGDHENPHSHQAIFKDGSWSFKE